MNKKRYTLRELAEFLATDFSGDPDRIITGIGSLDTAKPEQISFLKEAKYNKYLDTTKASAVITRKDSFTEKHKGNFIFADDPYLAYAKISALFDDTPKVSPGIHKTALIGKECEIGDAVYIGPYCVVGDNVKIGKGVQIGAGSNIGDNVAIEENSKLCANVTLYHKVEIGKRVILHSGVVIGSDGFGNANERGVWHKIYQLGTTVIGDDVEIGANSTIDRGAIGDTVIEDGVKIDNLVQIGHNVHIGAHTAIAGCVGIAGSTKIGRFCMLGGRAGIGGHLEIADRVIITAMTGVGKSITEPGGIYASAIPAIPHLTWWRIVSKLMKLENLIKRLKVLEKK